MILLNITKYYSDTILSINLIFPITEFITIIFTLNSSIQIIINQLLLNLINAINIIILIHPIVLLHLLISLHII